MMHKLFNVPVPKMANQHFLNAAGYLFILVNILFSLKIIIWSCVTFLYYFKGLNIGLKVCYITYNDVFYINLHLWERNSLVWTSRQRVNLKFIRPSLSSQVTFLLSLWYFDYQSFGVLTWLSALGLWIQLLGTVVAQIAVHNGVNLLLFIIKTFSPSKSRMQGRVLAVLVVCYLKRAWNTMGLKLGIQ